MSRQLRFVRRRGYRMAPKAPIRILVLQRRVVPAAGEAGRGVWPEWRDVSLDNSGA